MQPWCISTQEGVLVPRPCECASFEPMELDLQIIEPPTSILSTPGVPVDFTLRVTNLSEEPNMDSLWYIGFALFEIVRNSEGFVIKGDDECKCWNAAAHVPGHI